MSTVTFSRLQLPFHVTIQISFHTMIRGIFHAVIREFFHAGVVEIFMQGYREIFMHGIQGNFYLQERFHVVLRGSKEPCLLVQSKRFIFIC
jgi:hypothetical protein